MGFFGLVPEIFVVNGAHVATLLHSSYINKVNLLAVELQILADSGSTQIIPVILFFPDGRGVSV